MLQQCYTSRALNVVLLAEDVDRNTLLPRSGFAVGVVLLAEDVDRNSQIAIEYYPIYSRPPRGGRG